MNRKLKQPRQLRRQERYKFANSAEQQFCTLRKSVSRFCKFRIRSCPNLFYNRPFQGCVFGCLAFEWG